MIIDFTIKNYRSFKEDSTLSFIAEPLKDDGIALKETSFGDKVLPVAGIFGKNASGKSNVVKALACMRKAMRNSDYVNKPVKRNTFSARPFALVDSFHDQPTHFEITLWDPKEKTQYNYGFKLADSGVEAEWLELVDRPAKNTRSRLIFEREKNIFSFHSAVKERLQALEGKVLGTALAVNVFANFADPISYRLLELVSADNIKIINSADMDMFLGQALDRFYEDGALRQKVNRFIQDSDTDVKKVTVDRSTVSREDLLKSMPMPHELKKLIASADNSQSYDYTSNSIHHRYDDEGKPVDGAFFNLDFMSDESSGTQKLFALATLLIEALDNGEALILDEFGSSLHPFLTRKVVELFQDPNLNKHGAQLIFASHEIYLLNQSIRGNKFNLRRDQIWFADKGNDEASVLRCLAEYKTKKEYELSKRYLEGRFGAVPILKFEEGEI